MSENGKVQNDEKVESHDFAEIDKELTTHLGAFDTFKEKLIKNSAVSIAILSVIAYSFLFSYKASYVNYFSIPSLCITVDLKEYINIISIIIPVYVYALIYYYEYIAEKITNVYKYRFDRAIILVLIIYKIYPMIFNSSGSTLLVCSIVAHGIEGIIVLFINWRKKRKKKSNEKWRNRFQSLGNIEKGRIYARSTLMRRSKWIVILFLIYLVFQIVVTVIGTYKATGEKNFSIIYDDGKEYVVIVDYIGNAVVLEGDEDGLGNIVIDTGAYKYISKNDKTIQRVHFLDVKLNDKTIDYAKRNAIVTISPVTYTPDITPAPT